MLAVGTVVVVVAVLMAVMVVLVVELAAHLAPWHTCYTHVASSGPHSCT